MANREDKPPQGMSQTRFSMGEISPLLYGRLDFDGYYRGLKTCRNFIPTKYGPADNRPGTQFIVKVQNSNYFTRLIPFRFNDEGQSYILELGNFTMRIIINGALQTQNGFPIVIQTPWAATDLPMLKFIQSADVITVCHPNYPPMQIERVLASTTPSVLYSPLSPSPGPVPNQSLAIPPLNTWGGQ